MYCFFKRKRVQTGTEPKRHSEVLVGAQEIPSYPQVDESAVATSKSSSLTSKRRIDESVCGRFSSYDIFTAHKVQIEWITLEAGWFSIQFGSDFVLEFR